MIDIVKRSVRYAEYVEHYITIPRGVLSKEEFARMLQELEDERIQVMRADFFGGAASDAVVLYEHFHKSIPSLLLSDSEAQDTTMGVCLYGVQSLAGGEVVYHTRDNVLVGASFSASDRTIVVRSGMGSKMQYTDFEQEAYEEYRIISNMLQDYSLEPRHIYRYWNYMSDIVRYYQPFNTVRNEYYDRHTIRDYPAATGIEAQLPNTKNIFIGFEAITGDGVGIRTVSSDMQSDAWTYGPRFSRAVVLDFKHDNVKKIYISGTSTIDLYGKSILQDEPEKNVAYVIASVEHLLEKEQLNTNNIVSAYVYAVDDMVLGFFEALYRTRGYTFPYLVLRTPICRNDLLFEVECIAISNS
ncbi:hypothetical protein A3C87_00200 [Candidatus Kaiserbacteria bacterium RIFCSPHIGHO2_02_FULL_49_34]|uniref:Translation initiation inhibitor n=1 Tax=Candidatus Kaiserbacteria bacterium RIFCSPHIGHO2_02_FULL_49_34 TaxID=1798491 RepID=A0A1F6DIX5_9BACT|nr:MAG: hypothetical protein A3C87_00200 [Candidatus Kaiserbacteria bacterium RIFCSPHIGHO2_02_FULL_49_34]